ncbi:MAG TPA: AI-2E family transporter [Ktedonobacterales bacterium]|nr:AI-2E family transporter [Ktedonobacterales bacterium]
MDEPTPAPNRQPTAAAPADAPADAHASRPAFSITIAPHTIWYAAGAVIVLVVLWLLVTKALAALLIFFVAIIIGEAARPIVLQLEKRRVPRPLGVLLVLLVVTAVLALLIWILLAPLVAEVGALSANAPTYTTKLQEWISGWTSALQANKLFGGFFSNIASQVFNSLQGMIPSLISVPFTLLTGAFGALLSLVVTVTLTVFWLSSSARLKPFLVGLFPERLQPRVDDIFADMGRSLGGYVRGVLIAMLLIGVFTGAGLGVLGVPYALLLGVLAGLTEAIPYLGPWLSGAVSVIVALVTVDPLKALEVAVLFLLVQQLEGNLVQPLVMSRSVHLDPLLVLIAILVGSELLGLMGAVLAVPFVALLQSVVTHAIAPAIRAAARRDEPPPASGVAEKKPPAAVEASTSA